MISIPGIRQFAQYPRLNVARILLIAWGHSDFSPRDLVTILYPCCGHSCGQCCGQKNIFHLNQILGIGITNLADDLFFFFLCSPKGSSLKNSSSGSHWLDWSYYLFLFYHFWNPNDVGLYCGEWMGWWGVLRGANRFMFKKMRHLKYSHCNIRTVVHEFKNQHLNHYTNHH